MTDRARRRSQPKAVVRDKEDAAVVRGRRIDRRVVAERPGRAGNRVSVEIRTPEPIVPRERQHAGRPAEKNRRIERERDRLGLARQTHEPAGRRFAVPELVELEQGVGRRAPLGR